MSGEHNIEILPEVPYHTVSGEDRDREAELNKLLETREENDKIMKEQRKAKKKAKLEAGETMEDAKEEF